MSAKPVLIKKIKVRREDLHFVEGIIISDFHLIFFPCPSLLCWYCVKY